MKLTVVTVLLTPLLFIPKAAPIVNDTTPSAWPDGGEIKAYLRDYHENNVFKQRIKLAPSSLVTITVTDVASDIQFIVLQVHTFQYNATLAYDKTMVDRVSNRSLIGMNIGLHLKTHNATMPIRVFLKNGNAHELEALLAIVPYHQYAPIPGGCNMEFDIEIAPYQRLQATNETITIDTQPALAVAADGLQFPCEKNPIVHTMYRLYLPRYDFTSETYFGAIESMLTAPNILQNGDKIPAAVAISSMRRVYSAYTGTGSVYAAVATYGTYSSAYVPIFTYACSPLVCPESCEILSDVFSKVICTLTLLIGLLAFILSISIKKGSLDSIYSSLANSMIAGIGGYIVVAVIGSHSAALITGVILAVITVFILRWLRAFLQRMPFYQFFGKFPLSFLCVCIAYLYAPANMFYILENNWLFWPSFLCFVLALNMILTMMSLMPYDVTRTLSNTLFGSYFVIGAIDYFSGTNLKYIFINVIRRFTVPGFHLAFVYPPVQAVDIVMMVLWFLLTVKLFAVSYYVQRETSESSASKERERLPLHDNALRYCGNNKGYRNYNRYRHYNRYRYYYH